MNRRDLLKTGGSALLFAGLAPRFAFGQSTGDRLFFSLTDLPRIRANAQLPLLHPTFEQWKAEGAAALYDAYAQATASGDILRDFATAINKLTQVATVHLIEPTDELRDALLFGIEASVDAPKWDYFYDGDAVIGIMRASLATTRLLFAREVLGDDLPDDLHDRLLAAVAEKGCLPCYRTIVGMDYPDRVVGWRFDENHQGVYEIDMQRWPEILGANNLRAIPTMGLGLGALALRDHDPRAGLWLDTAVSSARHFLGTVSADGGYFEGLSYIDYAFRTILAFLEAHERVDGSIEWATQANFEGAAEFIVAMQAGEREDGLPDIVNFSDARRSTYPCVPAWIARQTGSEIAQYAAEHTSEPGYFLDFLWLEAERPAPPPPDRLKNVRLDLDWVICRSGWEPDDAVLAFRSGRPANHEHADRNSFFYKYQGERLLNDHFGAAYDWREPKWLLRLTEAHNAVLIDGEGHQYHNGEEGTNESQAESDLVRFEDDGDRVWWTSDATQAYHLVNADVRRVRRTILFAKPDVVVLLDQVETATPTTAAVRFFPDNRDGMATAQALGSGFAIERPKARLHGSVYARSGVTVTADQLDLDEKFGVYPFLEVATAASGRHEIVTVLVAQSTGSAATPTVDVQPDDGSWSIAVGDVRARITSVDGGTLGTVPEVTWL